MEKLKREIVIGNLVSGQIGAASLCELLNGLLKKVSVEIKVSTVSLFQGELKIQVLKLLLQELQSKN